MSTARRPTTLALIVLPLIGLLLFAGLRPAASGARPARAAAACANANLIPSATNLTQISSSLLCLVNQRRAAAGLVRLHANRQLARAARRHANDMARTLKLSHIGSAGDTLNSRVAATGYIRGTRGWVTAENLAWEATKQSTPAEVVTAWMASVVHRTNILDPRFRDTGIAAALAPPAPPANGLPGTPITEEFAARHY